MFFRKNNKKGYFFTIDAIIALIILVAGLLIVLAAFVGTAPTQQTQFFSQDIVDVYTKTAFNKILDISEINGIKSYANYDYARLGAMPTVDILGELYDAGLYDPANDPANPDALWQICSAVARINLPKNYGVQIELDDNIIYQHAPPTNPDKSIGVSTTATNTELHVFGERPNVASVWGPYNVEVKIWY